MKVENKHTKRFSEITTKVQDINNYGFGTGVISNKKDFVSKSSNGGGCCCCCCCCCGTGSADLK